MKLMASIAEFLNQSTCTLLLFRKQKLTTPIGSLQALRRSVIPTSPFQEMAYYSGQSIEYSMREMTANSF